MKGAGAQAVIALPATERPADNYHTNNGARRNLPHYRFCESSRLRALRLAMGNSFNQSERPDKRLTVAPFIKPGDRARSDILPKLAAGDYVPAPGMKQRIRVLP
jgi:hypothetical protein